MIDCSCVYTCSTFQGYAYIIRMFSCGSIQALRNVLLYLFFFSIRGCPTRRGWAAFSGGMKFLCLSFWMVVVTNLTVRSAAGILRHSKAVTADVRAGFGSVHTIIWLTRYGCVWCDIKIPQMLQARVLANFPGLTHIYFIGQDEIDRSVRSAYARVWKFRVSLQNDGTNTTGAVKKPSRHTTQVTRRWNQNACRSSEQPLLGC